MKCRLCKNQAMKRGGNGLCSVHYRRKLGYRGEPQGWVDPTETRAHIAELKRAGMPYRRIAQLIGKHEDTVCKIARGRPRIQAKTAADILAIECPSRTAGRLKGTSHVLSIGTSRRLQSLMAMGYTQQFMADEMGFTRAGISRIIGGRYKRVRADTAEMVKALFDRLQMSLPPDTPDSRKARTIAMGHGWPLPFQWDEDSIDRPIESPYQLAQERSDWFGAYAELKDFGLTDQRIAERMGITYEALQVRLRRWRERNAA